MINLPIVDWIQITKDGASAFVTSIPITTKVNGKQVFITPSYIIAKAIAKTLGARLLSKTAADYLHLNAEIALKPHIMPAGKNMSSLSYRLSDYEEINRQLEKNNWRPGILVSNIGKDWLHERPNHKHVYNYGWYRNGKPIQGLCIKNCHNDTHHDYSQKLRLIKNATDWKKWGYEN